MMKRRSNRPVPTTADALVEVAPFDKVPPGALRALTPHVDRLRLRPGAVIATEGRQARAFVAVLAGQVRATRDGHEVAVDGAGVQIGADSLLRHQDHDATWTAVSDVEILVVNGPAYRWALQELLADVA